MSGLVLYRLWRDGYLWRRIMRSVGGCWSVFFPCENVGHRARGIGNRESVCDDRYYLLSARLACPGDGGEVRLRR